MTTHVLMIVDMSGSMFSLAEDVRGGYNNYLSDLEADADNYSFTVTLFDTKFKSLCVATSLAETPRLDNRNYIPSGYTALLDAVGKTVTEFEAKQLLQEEDRVLVVVQTDGRENSSREFSKETVANLISEREKTNKWSFIFHGAGADTWAQASGMGFQKANTVSYERGSTRSAYSGISRGTSRYAGGQAASVFAAEVAEASGGEVHGRDENDSRGTDVSSQ